MDVAILWPKGVAWIISLCKKTRAADTRSALIFAVGDDQSPLQVVHLKGVYPYIWLLSHQRISTSKTTAQVRRKNSMYYWICLISHRLDTSQMSHCLSFHILSFTQTFIARLSCVTYLAKINQAGLWIPGIIISLWPWICLHLTLKQSCKCAATCLIQIIIAKHSEQYYIFVIFYSETILQNKYTWG